MTKFKLSSVIFVLGATLAGAAGIAILSSHQGFAQKMLTVFFWIIVLGTAVYSWEIRQNK